MRGVSKFLPTPFKAIVVSLFHVYRILELLEMEQRPDTGIYPKNVTILFLHIKVWSKKAQGLSGVYLKQWIAGISFDWQAKLNRPSQTDYLLSILESYRLKYEEGPSVHEFMWQFDSG